MTRQVVVPAYLLFCLVLGGASAAGFIANLALQLLALPLIGWAAWQLVVQRPRVSRSIGAILALLALLIVVMLVQLVPLPAAVWMRLPGREPVAAGYRLLGMALPRLPLTLAPDAALASLLWLLPAFATLLGVVVLGAFRPRWIAAAILLVTLVGIAVGALQVIGGDDAYFYAITNNGVAVGFFANANHNATLMLVSIPFLAALGSALVASSRSARSSSAIRLLVGAAYAVILVGLIINRSLAGIALGVPAALGSWLVFGRQRGAVRAGMLVLTVLFSAGALAVVTIDPSNNLVGQQHANIELSRQTSFALTWRAAGEYFPFGSGVGSFQPVYHTQERLDQVTATYMNHAHSDWLEVLLETGAAGVVLALAFLAWWGLRVHAIWRTEERDPFAQAAVVATAAVMLHSVVDYPLRTAALSAVFAACVGLMAGARSHVRRRGTPSTARHLSL